MASGNERAVAGVVFGALGPAAGAAGTVTMRGFVERTCMGSAGLILHGGVGLQGHAGDTGGS